MFSKPRIQLKSAEQLELMRAAGAVVEQALAAVARAAAPGVSTGELDARAEAVIRDAGGVPSFLGYFDYPKSLCTSINDKVVHGIPSEDDILAQGDLLSVDCGAILDGWHGDSAITIGIGSTDPADRDLVRVCADAMWAGIEAARPGNRLTDISHAVQQAVLAGSPDGAPYGIVAGYGGHGIGTEMHQDPHILNYGKPGRGPRLVPGMAVAIEPMITRGRAEVRELSDGWTVVTVDSSRAAHTEHSVAITDDGPWVLTASDGGASRLGPARAAGLTVG